MNWKTEWKKLALIITIFIICFYLPIEYIKNSERIKNSAWESLYLLQDYAKEHVILCLVPAFFIAGAIGVFVSQASVMKYLGAKAKIVLAYGVASVSGGILAVCSCTVLPLFSGIYKMGAGLGPATTFLYAGPAVNVLAIVLTARVLGVELGVARAVGAIVFSILIGLLMNFIFRKEEAERIAMQMAMPEPEVQRPLWKTSVFFALMVGVLVFANWGSPREFNFKTVDGNQYTAVVVGSEKTNDGDFLRLKLTEGDQKKEFSINSNQIVSKNAVEGISTTVWKYKWIVTIVIALLFAIVLILWFEVHFIQIGLVALASAVLGFVFYGQPMVPFIAGVIGLSVIMSRGRGETGEWFQMTWGFAKQILPLLFIGVVIAGALLGRPGHEGLIPSVWVNRAVGGNSLGANFFASIAGAFMYFATLTEVPILQGLINNGMGKGPALSLLLAGPALSLPNMLVIKNIMGLKKTVVYVSLVVVMATVSGIIYGSLF